MQKYNLIGEHKESPAAHWNLCIKGWKYAWMMGGCWSRSHASLQAIYSVVAGSTATGVASADSAGVASAGNAGTAS